MIYDDNHISIEDDTTVALDEDVVKRYEAYGWHTQVVRGGENVVGIREALANAKAETGRPSFIALRTVIGYPAPDKMNTGAAHGAALGEDEVRSVKEILGFDPDKHFAIDDDVLAHTRAVGERGKAAHEAWDKQFADWAQANPERRALLERMARRQLPDGWHDKLPTLVGRRRRRRHPQGAAEDPRRDRAGAPRAVGRLGRPRGEQQHHDQGCRLVRAVDGLDEPVGPDEPLRPHPALRGPRARDGLDPQRDRAARRHPRLRRHVPDLLRLHAARGPARGADEAADDLRLDARLDRPRRGRPDPPADRAARLAARGARACRSSARPTPTRPSAAVRAILDNPTGPVGLALTRQNLPILEGTDADGVARGGYVLQDASGGQPQLVLIATGSEVQLAVEARKVFEDEGVPTRVVSMPCVEWFEAQDRSYTRHVLPPDVKARVSVEAGIAQSWHRFVGDDGECVSIEHFGASADYKTLFQQFGFTTEHVVEAGRRTLARASEASA